MSTGSPEAASGFSYDDDWVVCGGGGGGWELVEFLCRERGPYL